MFLNIAAYQFLSLDRLPERRVEMRNACAQAGLKGTVMLSPEGINCFLAGQPDALRQWVRWLQAQEEFSCIEVKESFSEEMPFQRLLVKLKKEIIAFGVSGIDPVRKTSPKLPPQKLKQWLDEGRQVTLLDVRNDYEVRLGSFEGAEAIGVDHFRDFPEAVKSLPAEMKRQTIVMFCTGGIRCEKAGPLMEGQGFEQIYQLDGGILKYFEECGEAHYEGDCFVFDGRVALDPRLRPTAAAVCFACQAVVTAEEQMQPSYVVGQSCPHCFVTPEMRQAQQLVTRAKTLQRVTSPLPGSLPYTNRRPIRIPQVHDNKHLIDALTEMHPHIDRNRWLQWFEAGQICRGSIAVEPGLTVRAGQEFSHLFPETVEPPVSMEIDFLYEDEAIVAVNKSAPLPMHPCGRFNRNTLTSILNQVYAPEVLRPAHRLDANTTGVVIFSRRQKYARLLQPAFQSDAVRKTYLVRCQGHPNTDQFSCQARIARHAGEAGSRQVAGDGLTARTDFRVMQRLDDHSSLLEACPITGRTNQIRIHLHSLGFPVVGDPVYGPTMTAERTQTRHPDDAPMCLHAWTLTFPSPLTGQMQTITAPAPNWAALGAGMPRPASTRY